MASVMKRLKSDVPDLVSESSWESEAKPVDWWQSRWEDDKYRQHRWQHGWKSDTKEANWWSSDWRGEVDAEKMWPVVWEGESEKQKLDASVAGFAISSTESPTGEDRQEIQLAGKSWLVAEALKSLHEFILDHPLDSFTRTKYLGASPADCCFIEDGKRLLLNFPACCPCTYRYNFEEPLDKVGSLMARQKLAAKVLINLNEHGYIDDDLKKLHVRPRQLTFPHHTGAPWKAFPSTGGENVRLRLPSKSWKHEVSLYAIKSSCIRSQLGILSHVRANFCYHFTCQGQDVLIEATQVPWDCNNCDLVECFNEQLLSECPTKTDLRLALNRDGILDFEGMDKFCRECTKFEHASFLHEVIWKLDRLSWWETARRMGPVDPAPSPLKMHLIFDCDDADSRDARKALAIVGEDALRLVAAVACLQDHPTWSVEQLDGRVQELLDKSLLAELLVRSKLPQYGERSSMCVSEASEMLLALIGSYKLESDLFAVTRLWTWLTEDNVLQKAMLHLSSVPKILGRTPSYIGLSEINPGDNDSDSGVAWLKVLYEDSDDCIYRWRGNRAEELRLGVAGATWKTLIWDASLLTFCSPSMLLRDGSCRPLPSKVCAWLRGFPISKLVSQKPQITTPPYTVLREEIDEFLGDNNTWLLVKYTEYDDYVAYRRSTTGGLGYEIFQMKGDASQVKHLDYSESKKTILSKALPGWPLPKKVVNWLLDLCCLVELIPGRKKVDAHVKLKCEGGEVTWTSSTTGKVYTIRHEAVLVGVIYTARAMGTDEWDALAYSEEQREWLVTGEIPEIVPSHALSYLSDHVRKICSGELAVEGPVPFMASRGIAPQSVRYLLPQLSGSALVEVEQALRHRFCSHRLLAEALTHCSAKMSLTPSCERLAIVGHAALCSFTSDFIMRRNETQPWFTGALLNGSNEVGSLIGNCSWPIRSSWCRNKEIEKAQSNSVLDIHLGDLEAMKSCHLACCNHTTFAFTCVKLGLHKAINPPPSDELNDAIDAFVKRVDAFIAKPQEFLPVLLRGGAPKVLGDVFLACIGAVIMDSDHTEVTAVLEMHLADCVGFTNVMKQGSHLVERLSNLQDDDKLDRTMTANYPVTAIHSQIVIDAFSTLCNYHDRDAAQTLACTSDVALVEVESELYLSTTPRAALMQALVTDVIDGAIGGSPDDKSFCAKGVVADSTSSAADQTSQLLEHDGAIYCRKCDKWLNGLTQWTDHEIGKKHRKACRQKYPTIHSDTQETLFTAKQIKAVPEGFGKKPQEADGKATQLSSQSVQNEEMLSGESDKKTAASKESMISQSYSEIRSSSSIETYPESMLTTDAGRNYWCNTSQQAYYACYLDPRTGGVMAGLMMPESLLPQYHQFLEYQ